MPDRRLIERPACSDCHLPHNQRIISHLTRTLLNNTIIRENDGDTDHAIKPKSCTRQPLRLCRSSVSPGSLKGNANEYTRLGSDQQSAQERLKLKDEDVDERRLRGLIITVS